MRACLALFFLGSCPSWLGSVELSETDRLGTRSVPPSCIIHPTPRPPLFPTLPPLLSTVIFATINCLAILGTLSELLWPTSLVAVLIAQELVRGLTIGRG